MMRGNKGRQIRLSLPVFWQYFFLLNGICFVVTNVVFSQELVIAFSMGHQHSNMFFIDEKGKLEPLNLTQQKDIGQRNGHPTWSPDGTRIAFDTNRKGKANYEIFLMAVDGANPRNLSKSDKDDKEPAWPPKGNKICFKSKRDGNWDIYKMDVDGQNVVRLTDDPAKDDRASWSPDGGRIAFTRCVQAAASGSHF